MRDLDKMASTPGTDAQTACEAGAQYSDNFATLFAYAGSDTCYQVDARCTSIAAHAFESAPLTEIVFPEGLEHIGEAAFKGCRSLSKADFPHEKHAICLEQTGLMAKQTS